MKLRLIYITAILALAIQNAFACQNPKYCSGGTTLDGNQAGSYICGCNDPAPTYNNPRLGEQNSPDRTGSSSYNTESNIYQGGRNSGPSKAIQN